MKKSCNVIGKSIRALVLTTIIAAVAAFFCGCGNSYYPGNGDSGGTDSVIVETDGERKLLREIDINIAAEKGKTQETTSGVVAALTAAEGKEIGRYGSTSSSYSYIRLTLKVPSDKVDAFLGGLRDKYKTSNEREYVTDVTEKYNVYKAQADELRQKKTVYEQLYDDSSATVADKLAILDKLDEINASLKEATAQTSPYEGLGSYATVNVYIDAETNETAGIALTVIFGVVLPIGLAVALIVVGIKLSDANKRLKQIEKSEK